MITTCRRIAGYLIYLTLCSGEGLCVANAQGHARGTNCQFPIQSSNRWRSARKEASQSELVASATAPLPVLAFNEHTVFFSSTRLSQTWAVTRLSVFWCSICVSIEDGMFKVAVCLDLATANEEPSTSAWLIAFFESLRTLSTDSQSNDFERRLLGFLLRGLWGKD